MESEVVTTVTPLVTVPDIDNLSETDRALLKKVADSNTAVLIQMKKNKLTSTQFINDTYGKLKELLQMVLVVGGAMWAFDSLPSEMKDKAAQRYLDAAVPTLITVVGAGSMMKSSKDRKDRSAEVDAETIELQQLEDEYKKGQV
jgi:hypothetical protein